MEQSFSKMMVKEEMARKRVERLKELLKAKGIEPLC
jgi:hypothetical protein